MVSSEDVGPLIVPPSENLKVRDELLVFIRPSDIRLLHRDDNKAADNSFEGVIEQATYLGEKVDYRIKAGSKLEIRVQAVGMSRFTRDAIR